MAGENYMARRQSQPAPQSFIKPGLNTGVYAPAPKEVKATQKPKTSVVGGITKKITDVGSQTLDIAGSLGKKTAGFVANRAVDVGQAAALTAKTARDIVSQPIKNTVIVNNNLKIDQKYNDALAAYKSGKMSKDEYSKTLIDISKAYQDQSNNSKQISSGPTPMERGQAVFETGTNVLSLGALGLAKTGAKEATNLATKTLSKEATKLEQIVQKVPAVKALVERNAATAAKRSLQMLPGESAVNYTRRLGSNAAFGLLVKQPIFYQTNIGGAQEVYNKILEGNYPSALKQTAWLSTQLLKGGPLGAAAQGFSWLKNRTSKLTFGTGSYIDELSKNSGNRSATQIGDYLQSLDKNSDEFKNAERVLRIAQETNLQMAGENAKDAAERTLVHWSEAGINLENVTPKEIISHLQNWADAHEKLTILGKAGKLGPNVKESLDNHVVGRWDVKAKNALAQQFEDSTDNVQDLAAIIRAWADHPGNAAGNNRLLTNKLDKIVVDGIQNAPPGQTQKYIADKIRQISAASVSAKDVPSKYAKEFEKLGFMVIQPYQPGKVGQAARAITPKVAYEETRKLVTSAVKGDPDFVETQLTNPFLTTVASGLRKLGISPEAATKISTISLSNNVAARLSQTQAGRNLGVSNLSDGSIMEGGKAILNKLQQYVDDLKPNPALNLAVLNKAPGPAIVDIRQLTNGEIVKALAVDKYQAQEIRKAILQGYLDVPLELRGLGDRIIDRLYQANPVHRLYSRAQSALRYTYNPFFRFQETVETPILAKLQARTILWGKSNRELDEGFKVLQDVGLFKSGLSGQAAQDLTIGRITANITQSQKRHIAGLAYKMAEARGTTIDDLVRNYGDEVGDALRVVVQYPNKGILSSSLGRVLNLAFFPMRYNTKVTLLAGQILAKEPPSVQLAVLNSVLDMKNWLNSPEGVQWKQAHADTFQVLEWATPLNSITYWHKIFTDGDPNAPGDFGSLGGLPLGIITQQLDSQGLINLNKPYVNPKTGDVLPKYIPKDIQARASVAISDLLGSLFTYPGRVLGLPGKQQQLNNLSQALTGTDQKDFTIKDQTDRLTPMQERMVQILKDPNNPELLDSLYRSPAPGQYNGFTLPDFGEVVKPISPRLAPNIQQSDKLPSKADKAAAAKKAKTPRVKTAQPIPSR